jgi:hypothetical protein
MRQRETSFDEALNRQNAGKSAPLPSNRPRNTLVRDEHVVGMRRHCSWSAREISWGAPEFWKGTRPVLTGDIIPRLCRGNLESLSYDGALPLGSAGHARNGFG